MVTSESTTPFRRNGTAIVESSENLKFLVWIFGEEYNRMKLRVYAERDTFGVMGRKVVAPQTLWNLEVSNLLQQITLNNQIVLFLSVA